MIDIIKKITGEYDDIVIEFNINKACISINNYLNKTFEKDEIIEKYQSAVIQFCANSITNYQNKNVKSMTQGQRSVVFSDNVLMLGDDVKALLPKPYVRFK